MSENHDCARCQLVEECPLAACAEWLRGHLPEVTEAWRGCQEEILKSILLARKAEMPEVKTARDAFLLGYYWAKTEVPRAFFRALERRGDD